MRRALVLFGLLLLGCPSLDGFTGDAGTDASCDTALLGSDSQNCGQCGHDCLGGLCFAGACQPSVVRSNVAVSHLAQDTDTLFWADSTNVWRCDKSDCAGTATQLTNNMSNGGSLDGLMVDGDTLVYSLDLPVTNGSQRTFWRMGKDGSARTQLFAGPLRPNNDPVSGPVFALDGSIIYWETYVPGPPDEGIMRCTLPACTDRTPVVTGATFLDGVWLDAQTLYFLDKAGPDRVGECPRTTSCGSQPTSLYVAAGAQRSIPAAYLLDQYVYFTEDDSSQGALGSVRRVPITGGSAATLAPNQQTPVDIAADDQGVYWSTSSDLKIFMAPSSGGDPVVLASGQDLVDSLLTDATTIYWGSSAGLVRLAR